METSHQFLFGSEGTESQAAPCSRKQFFNALDSGLIGVILRISFGRFRFLLPEYWYRMKYKTVHDWLDYYIHRDSTTHMDKVALPGGNIDYTKKKESVAQCLMDQTDDMEYVRSQVLQTMFAAREKTAILISNAIFLLARHPAIWQKLREEMILYPDRDELFTYDNIMSFTYVQNILNEGMLESCSDSNGRFVTCTANSG